MTFPIDRLEEIKAKPHDFRLLEKVPFTSQELLLPFNINTQANSDLNIVFLDVETTGLRAGTDKIIELGMVFVKINATTGELVQISSLFDNFEDPQQPITSEITELTGITNDMVNGLALDEATVKSWAAFDPIIIAHNAKFDRAFFEARFPELTNLRWGCSCHDIDWNGKGVGGKSLESLIAGEGYFYEAHRASIDCLAMTWLFFKLPTYMLNLLASVNAEKSLIQLTGNTYSFKETLKEHQYRWNGSFWGKEVLPELVTGEMQFLDSINNYSSSLARVTAVTARERHR